MQSLWSSRAQHQKSPWSLKTGILEKRVEYAVQDASFWLSKCYLCRFTGHEADLFPTCALISCGFCLWQNLTSEVTLLKRYISFLLQQNNRLIIYWLLVSSGWSNCPAWILNNLLHVFVLSVTWFSAMFCHSWPGSFTGQFRIIPLFMIG